MSETSERASDLNGNWPQLEARGWIPRQARPGRLRTYRGDPAVPVFVVVEVKIKGLGRPETRNWPRTFSPLIYCSHNNQQLGPFRRVFWVLSGRLSWAFAASSYCPDERVRDLAILPSASQARPLAYIEISFFLSRLFWNFLTDAWSSISQQAHFYIFLIFTVLSYCGSYKGLTTPLKLKFQP